MAEAQAKLQALSEEFTKLQTGECTHSEATPFRIINHPRPPC